MTDQGDSNAVTGQRPQRYRYVILVGVVAALVITAMVSFRWGATLLHNDPVVAKPTPPAAAPEKLTVAQIYQTLAPSVVSIKAGGASGTGLIANADGVILTALHVVEGGQPIEVIFGDGTRSPATIAGADPAIDIAVLIPASLPSVVVPAVIGGSGLSVGDEVVAIGNPLGLTESTTSGVVSGLGRSAARTGGNDIEGLIQFDAAVNPGSSGGPLVNARGQTVGIVVALANPTEAGTFIGIGFAVPIGTAIGAGEGQLPQL